MCFINRLFTVFYDRRFDKKWVKKYFTITYCYSVTRTMHTKYISIQWEKPMEFGDVAVTGYKVYVNGVVGANLPADQTTFTFTHGKWCKQYIFQVQVCVNVSLVR